MSNNRLIAIINEDKRIRRKWRKLSDAGKQRVLNVANGDDFDLLTLVEEIYREERKKI